ncbi:MAG: efflux RND transporter periplasmic adaptor subunit, partial [Amphiplicatus sp.]
AQAKAAYEAALADQRAAELDLERTNVKAPFKGRVRSRLAGKGQYVAPGAQLGRIFATDVVEIRLALADSDLAQLGLPIGFVESAAQPGPPAVLHATVAGEEREWQGRIARNDGAIDPSTRQTYAIAVVDDPYGEGADEGTPLAVGLFVRATIKGRPYDNAVTLPRSALYGRDTIYVIDDENRLRGRTVRVVFAGRDTITIAGEIAAGEKIAASPLRGANEGDKVAPTDPNAVKAGEQASAAAETIVQGERM